MERRLGMATRILVANDHETSRSGVKRIVATLVDLTVVDEAAGTQDLFSKVHHNDYDIVILDVSMPGRKGLDALVELKLIRPKLPVLVLSAHPEEQFALRAYKYGASGYLAKGTAPGELVAALHEISSGKKYVSATLAESLVSSGLGNLATRALLSSLSNREYQVITLIASGKTVRKIAMELVLSVNTVRSYRAHILSKLNLKNNAELTRFVIEEDFMCVQRRTER